MSRSVDFLSRASSSAGSAGPSNLPSNCSILITDTLSSPSLFLLTQFISRTLRKPSTTLGTGATRDHKGKGKARVILVGVREVEGEYTNILKKQSVQLGTEKTLGKFEFVDGSDGDLVRIYSTIASILTPTDTRGGEGDQDEESALVIVDDLSALSWMGNDLNKVVKFHLALKGLCITTHSTLVSVIHFDSVSPHPVVQDEQDQYLFRKALQSSEYWFELKSLVSQARGELSIHPGPALLPLTNTDRRREERLKTRVGREALEYTLEENGAVFEVKGLGRFI